jgi:hypothetical protein
MRIIEVPAKTLYELDFLGREWNEIEIVVDMSGLGGSIDGWTRMEWLAIAYLLIGKASVIDAGRYDTGDEDDNDNPAWATELREIAAKILDQFKPDDGKV